MRYWLLGLIILVSVPSLALAQSFEDSVYVAPDEVRPYNFVRVGNQITIKGKIVGDVVALGKNVNVTGEVAGDVLGAASDFFVAGPVAGNVRVAGQTVILEGTVAKNVMVAGSRVIIDEGAVIAGSLDVYAESLEIRGRVVGPVYGSAASVVVSGSTGSLHLETDTLSLAPTAKIDGDLWYQGSVPLQQATGAMISGKTTFEQVTSSVVAFPQMTIEFWWSRILKLFSLLAVALVAFAVARRLFALASLVLYKQTVVALTTGLLATTATPLLAVLLLLTVVGIPLAVVMVAVMGLLLYLGQIVTGYFLGRFFWVKVRPEKPVSLQVEFISGLAMFVLLGSVPWFGGALTFVGAVAGAGSFLHIVRELLTPVLPGTTSTG